MRKISDYIVMHYADASSLIKNYGWELYGNPFVGSDGSILQALVKYESAETLNAEELRGFLDSILMQARFIHNVAADLVRQQGTSEVSFVCKEILVLMDSIRRALGLFNRPEGL